MRTVLVSTYDSGHQPFALASAAAWLAARGHSVACADLAVNPLPSLPVREADAVAFYLPMHTATRLALDAIAKVKLLNPAARLIAFGLYAPLNADLLRERGVGPVIGGEFEAALVDAVEGRGDGTLVPLERLDFRVPDRTPLPALPRYSKLHINGSARVVGYTEASRGCKHLCRHCPVVPVYQGRFRVVPADVVLEDIRRQVAAGAQHITFGDPDFFNGPAHAMRIVGAMHAEFPALTFDATIKVEHMLAERARLAALRDSGCLYVTTAVESVDDAMLARLDKGHTRADFFELVRLCAELGLTLAPTFVPFTPWASRAGYVDLLRTLAELGLVEHVAPVQLALRLLLPAGSLLLELDDVKRVVTGFDAPALLHRWKHEDPEMDRLAAAALRLVAELQKKRCGRDEIFAELWRLAAGDVALPQNFDLVPRAAIPYMDEPWYC